MKTNRKHLNILIIILIFVATVVIGFLIYVSHYYHADHQALATIDDPLVYQQDFYTVFSSNSNTDTAIIFYPGGKVEAIAYAPLLMRLATAGTTCILAEMPFNLAVFNIDAADQVREGFSDVENWYLMGHSLGGAMASVHLQDHPSEYRGLILLGAYPVSESIIPTLTIYGSEDRIINLDKLTDSDNIVCLTGGNHAQFGNYGKQKGDGIATISNKTQQQLAITEIIQFIKETKV